MSRPMPLEEMVKLFTSRHTTSHLFKIDNFSLLKKYDIEKIESSEFDLGGHKWKLYVYPNGGSNGYNHVSMYLENQAPINVHLRYELFVVNQLRPVHHPSGISDFGIHSDRTMKGFHRLIPLAGLQTKGYLIEDCFMVGVELCGIKPAKSGTGECFSLIEKPLNHKVTWMMTKFSSFDPEKAHYSDEFVVGNRKWRIEVHPRGFKEGKDKSFSVYLQGEGFMNNAPKTQTFAKYKLRVFDQVRKEHVEKTTSGWLETRLGFADFMPLRKLDEPYLVNDKFYVGVVFEVISVATYC